jgi:hypothetical protein
MIYAFQRISIGYADKGRACDTRGRRTKTKILVKIFGK